MVGVVLHGVGILQFFFVLNRVRVSTHSGTPILKHGSSAPPPPPDVHIGRVNLYSVSNGWNHWVGCSSVSQAGIDGSAIRQS